jgi:hypothetical protein
MTPHFKCIQFGTHARVEYIDSEIRLRDVIVVDFFVKPCTPLKKTHKIQEAISCRQKKLDKSTLMTKTQDVFLL